MQYKQIYSSHYNYLTFLSGSRAGFFLLEIHLEGIFSVLAAHNICRGYYILLADTNIPMKKNSDDVVIMACLTIHHIN